MIDGTPDFISEGRMALGPIARGKEARGAEGKRIALKRALQDANMSPAEAARAADLPSPNALYNFFNGRAKSLSLETYQRLAQVVPGATIATLQGMERAVPGVARTIAVKAEARAGTWRDTFDLAPGEQEEVPVPIDPAMRAAGAFGVVVRRPGAELLYPEGTILVVMPIGAFEGTVTAGRRVVLQRIEGKNVEVTVREIEVRGGKAWLWPRSSDPLYVTPIEMPWPCSADRMWRKEDQRYSIAGVVIGSYTPEG